MIANIVIITLIIGYCIFLIYKAYKNHKEGKHVGCAGCSGNCGSCGGCSTAVGKSQYTKKKQKVIRMGNSTGSMFYAFGAFLLIYLVGVFIYQIYLWVKKWRENREEKED